MSNRKNNTLKMKLFRSYSVLFIFMLGIFSVFIYLYFYSQIRQQVVSRQQQTCSTVENALLNQINQCDTLVMNILFSSLVRSSFETQISLYQQHEADYFDNSGLLYSNATECSMILSNIVGMTENIAQVNLYDLNGNMIGYGMYNGRIFGNMYASVWFQPTKTRNGLKYLSPPHSMEWISSGSSASEESYISLTRTYKNHEYESIGYVEVTENCTDFFSYIDTLIADDSELDIYVFNSDQECLYPYSDLSNEKLTFYQSILSGLSTDISTQQQGRIISAHSSLEENLIVLVSQPQSVIYNALSGFNTFFSILGLSFLAVILFLSFALANQITRPLHRLQAAIKQVTLPGLTINEKAAPLKIYRDVDEINDVIVAFNRMYDTLSDTMNELLFAKSEEINSKILAVQAQMNPHFLYNNLSNISVMAEEQMNPQIIATCNDIIFMLRYIAVQNSSGIELYQEIEYTHRYLNCMKIRYEDDLNIKIDIPESMQDIIVPKLILQPLVENSVKYGLCDSPPWLITVTGTQNSTGWTIVVSDSGNGFAPDVLTHLKHEMERFDLTAQIPSLTLSGMGLLNLYIRVKLLYKENAVFILENLPGKGAAVTVECRINTKKEKPT